METAHQVNQAAAAQGHGTAGGRRVSGGASRNPVLMAELRRRCRGVAVGGSDRFGVPAEAREALVFALLAWWHVSDYPGNAPAITGAAREARLGVKASPA